MSRKLVTVPRVLSFKLFTNECSTSIKDMFLIISKLFFNRKENFTDFIQLFYTNLKFDGFVLTSKVKDVDIVFTHLN